MLSMDTDMANAITNLAESKAAHFAKVRGASVLGCVHGLLVIPVGTKNTTQPL